MYLYTAPNSEDHLINFFYIRHPKIIIFRTVDVAQLVDQSLPTPEIRSSNPAMDKINSLSTVLKTVEKTEKKKKSPGMA